MTQKRDTIAWVVTIVALLLLVASILVIINQGIPALNSVAIPVSVVAHTPAPTRAVLAPTAAGSPMPAGGLATASPAMVAAGGSTATIVDVTVMPIGLPTSVPIACPNPISDSDRVLFDAGNGALENATSHRFNFDLTFALDAGAQGSGSLMLGGSGFLQNRPDGGIEFQVDTTNAFVYPPSPGASSVTANFSVPMRFDMKNIYFRIVVPDRGIDSPWFAIAFDEILNEATGGSFAALMPIGISGSTTPDGSLMGLDIKALEGSTGFFDLFNLSRFICTRRLVDSGGQAHFTSGIDVASFLESSEFANALDSVMAMSGGEGTGTGAAMTAMIPALLSQYISKLQVNIDHYVNNDDRNLASVTLNVNVGFKLPDAAGAVLPMNFRLTGTINYSDYNRSQTLDIPPNPTQLERLEDLSSYFASK